MHKIQNHKELATDNLRRDALDIADNGLWAIDTKEAVRRNFEVSEHGIRIAGRLYPFRVGGGIYVCGVGKASYEAARELENILGNHIAGGVIIDTKPNKPLKRIQALNASHPFPDVRNIQAASVLRQKLHGLGERDLVIALISGGGSVLLASPSSSNLKEELLITRALFHSGANIKELNTVRKHLSDLRGGGLASLVYPAEVAAVVFSDVPGDDLQFIASGPFAKDETTRADAASVLYKYKILDKCSLPGCGLVETPKEEKYFARIRHSIIVSAKTAVEAMSSRAESLGYDVSSDPLKLSGEAKKMGEEVASILHDAPRGKAFIFAGETTVVVSGGGRGGRNLEVALSACQNLKEEELILTLASDGRDNGDFAGAIADEKTLDSFLKHGINLRQALSSNDTYPAFEKAGNFIYTGSTGSNVSDLLIAIKAK